MPRPRTPRPFDDIRIGRSRRFSVPDYTSQELSVLIKAAYRRRYPSGAMRYTTRAGGSPMGLEWVEITRVPDTGRYDHAT